MLRARQVEHHEAPPVSRLRGAAMMGGWFALLLGCHGPDPEGKFNDFIKETRETVTEAGTTGTPTTGAATMTDGTMTDGTMTDATTGGPEVFDISGQFLLAVATVVDQDKPLQFITTTTMTEVDGKQKVSSLCMQPLTLMQGLVTMPRQPIGDPLCFKDLAVDNGRFTLDAGVVMLTGMANPITGANIVASLIMAAEIKSDDLYCGAVTGNVTEPPVGDIEGSTFAAVRLADATMLPNPVVVDCAGRTVTDP